MKKIVLMSAVLVLLASPMWANLLFDAGFESGTFGTGIGSWAQWKGTNSAFSTTYALSGVNSLNIFGGGEHGVFQTVNVTPGAQYMVTVNVMGDQNYVGWKFGAGGTQWEFAPVNKDYNEWKPQTWWITPTENTVTIYLDSESGSFPGYYDDVSLTAVPEPGSVVALLGGLASMAAFAVRRRK